MKEIGRGWQYKVYDLGNGRVRKIKYSGVSQYFKIFWAHFKSSSIFPVYATLKSQRRVNRMEKISNDYIRSILTNDNAELFGNPVFLNNTDYEQDKVKTLRDVLRSSTVEDMKKVLDDYVRLIHIGWQYGFSDCVFKFLRNNGIDNGGTMIQLDFGEITEDKKTVERLIANKEWLKSVSFRELASKELQDYYKKITDEELTTERLNHLWRANLT